MENLIPNPPSPNLQDNSQSRSKFSRLIFVIVIILSLVFGSLGGSLGTFYVLHKPFGQKLLSKYFNITEQHNVTLNEDSAIINVVKKTSPSVVSIVVSEDLNKIPGYGVNDNQNSPFDFFFGNSSGGNQSPQGSQNDQSQGSTQPNVQEVAAGSGFFVSADGLILTNKHVVSTSGASYTVITSDGKTYDATVLAKDPVLDLALVKINIKNAPYLTFSDSSKLQAGQQVVAIGNSLGQYQNTVTSGIVSGIGRKVTAGGQDGNEDLSGVIQTDAAINPGNSGGPLLDLEGNVVGINTAIDEQGQLVGFALPSNDAAKTLASYQKNGKITRSFLGVRYIILTPAIKQDQNLEYDYGALVVRGDAVTDFAVQPGSPADKAGLMENDIILEVNGQKVDYKNTLSDILKEYNAGDSIDLKISHKGTEKNITVTLGEIK